MTKTIIQTIVILDPIRALTNINRTEKELLSLLSQLDKKFHCIAFNQYLSSAIGVEIRYIQKMLAHLQKLCYITRELKNGYIRKITTVFSSLFKTKIRTSPPVPQDTNKEDLRQNSTTIISKEEKIKNFLDANLNDQEQLDYQTYIQKKGDYTTVNYLNLYFHKGWLKWFKASKELKEKGLAIANLLRNGKNKLIGSMSFKKDFNQTRQVNNSLNQILNKYAR